MRVNPRVLQERQDLLGDIKIPESSHCPSQIKTIAENILTMCTKLDYSCPDYNTMSELDKILMVQYWREYDGMPSDKLSFDAFEIWFVEEATSPEWLRRSREWLCSHNYLLVKSDVQENAIKAGDRMRMSVRK